MLPIPKATPRYPHVDELPGVGVGVGVGVLPSHPKDHDTNESDEMILYPSARRYGVLVEAPISI